MQSAPEIVRVGPELRIVVETLVGDRSAVVELVVAVAGPLAELRGGAVGGDAVHPR